MILRKAGTEMKTVTKILIAVCAVVLIAAVIIGVAVARLKVNVPELDNQKKLENPINTA